MCGKLVTPLHRQVLPVRLPCAEPIYAHMLQGSDASALDLPVQRPLPQQRAPAVAETPLSRSGVPLSDEPILPTTGKGGRGTTDSQSHEGDYVGYPYDASGQFPEEDRPAR